VSIANAMMPAGLAAGISPYLRYMRQLTPAQQAAAANLGHFPRASEIGRDDPRIAQYSRPVARPAQTGPDAGLIPAGQPLGRRDAERLARQERDRERERNRERSRQSGRERERPPEPIVATTTTTNLPSRSPQVALVARPVAAMPRPVATRPPPVAPAPVAAVPAPVAAVPSVAPPPLRAPVVVARLPQAPAATQPPAPTAASRPIQGPSFDLLPPSGTPAPSAPVVVAALAPVPAPAPVPVSTPAPAPAPRSLADAFSEFGRPTISITPAPGAVDVRRIAAARPAAPKEAKPAVPAQPSRIWVQVATGRDKRALAFDWRKMSRENTTLFRSRKPYVAGWGQTNRLLTGPFESESAAGDFMNKLRKADVAGAFLWTSPAGQVVDDLSLGR
jgi:hypothetical protein